MPYVNIRVTRENGTPTAEQKAELIKGATELLVRVSGQNPAEASAREVACLPQGLELDDS